MLWVESLCAVPTSVPLNEGHLLHLMVPVSQMVGPPLPAAIEGSLSHLPIARMPHKGLNVPDAILEMVSDKLNPAPPEPKPEKLLLDMRLKIDSLTKECDRLEGVVRTETTEMQRWMWIVLSTLLTLLSLLLYSFKSVADVLKGIRNKGLTQSRWDALLGYRGAVCRHGPCGPISSLDPWDWWIPPDLHGFKKCFFDSLDLLNGFLKQVVDNRRNVGGSQVG